MQNETAVLGGCKGKRNRKGSSSSRHLLIEDIAEVARHVRVGVDKEARKVHHVEGGEAKGTCGNGLHGHVHLGHFDGVRIGRAVQPRQNGVERIRPRTGGVNHRKRLEAVASVSGVTKGFNIGLPVLVNVVAHTMVGRDEDPLLITLAGEHDVFHDAVAVKVTQEHRTRHRPRLKDAGGELADAVGVLVVPPSTRRDVSDGEVSVKGGRVAVWVAHVGLQQRHTTNQVVVQNGGVGQTDHDVVVVAAPAAGHGFRDGPVPGRPRRKDIQIAVTVKVADDGIG